MFDEEMITKYRYIILLLGTAVSFVFGFAVAFALAKLCGVMAVKAVLNIAFTVSQECLDLCASVWLSLDAYSYTVRKKTE